MGKYSLKKTNKELSVEQEDYIAKIYNGRRSPSSGAQAGDRGDIRFNVSLEESSFKYIAECKATRNQSISVKKETWLKIKEEAEDSGKTPTMFLRFYDETTGEKIDLVVRDVRDDLEIIYSS